MTDKNQLKLAAAITALLATKKRLNIHQVSDAYKRAKIICETAEPLLDCGATEDEQGLFLLMIAAFGHNRELNLSDLEELSGRAKFLHGLLEKVSTEN